TMAGVANRLTESSRRTAAVVMTSSLAWIAASQRAACSNDWRKNCYRQQQSLTAQGQKPLRKFKRLAGEHERQVAERSARSTTSDCFRSCRVHANCRTRSRWQDIRNHAAALLHHLGKTFLQRLRRTQAAGGEYMREVSDIGPAALDFGIE